MSALKGDLNSIKALKSKLRALPVTMAHDIAQQAAPAMTSLTQDAHANNRTVYGEPRPMGVDGQPLTLEKTGATKRTLRFAASGTIIRCVLGTRYARYLIGKYSILPNGPLPVGWSRRLEELVRSYRAL